jgi:hypothetical protein
MDNHVVEHLQNLYGLHPNMLPIAFQFPRLPPGLAHPMFKINSNPSKEKFENDLSTINQKLTGFQHLYQQYAASLLSMNSSLIPPGHPLYNRHNSIESLKSENDKLVKENLELKKKLDKKNQKD